MRALKIKLASNFFGALFLAFGTVSADAHPHIFMDCGTAFVFGAGGLEGVRLKWVFDEFYSETIMLDFDENKDGLLEKSEASKVEKGSFANLNNFHYFTCLGEAGKKPEVIKATHFSAEFSSGRAVFEFFIPFVVEASTDYKNIELAVYDDTYYTDIIFVKKDPVVFENDGGIDCEYRIAADKKHSYYFGEIIPKVIKVKFRKIR